MTPADLLGLGLKLFPVTAQKRPAMVGWQKYAVGATLDDLRADWKRGFRAFGIYLRPSRLVVLDADTPVARSWAAAVLPDTPMMTLTKRGDHRFYRLPDGAKPPKDNRPIAGVALDRKAKGYVIAPGSLLGGFTYEPVSYWDTPLAELPEYPAHLFPPERDVEPCSVSIPDIRENGVTTSILKWFMENCDDSIEGQNGSKAMKRAASFLVNGLALPLDRAEIWIDVWNQRKATPPWGLRELRHALDTSRREGAITGRPRGWAYTDWARS
jgi:Bifunctional DNA primase/polymerase, N-terminal